MRCERFTPTPHPADMTTPTKNPLNDYHAGANYLLAAVQCGRDLEEVFSELLRGQFGESLWAYAGAMNRLATLTDELALQGLLPPPENSRTSQFLHSDAKLKGQTILACTVKATGTEDPLALAGAMLEAVAPHLDRVRVHPKGWLTIRPESEDNAEQAYAAAVQTLATAEKEYIAALDREIQAANACAQAIARATA